MGREIEGDFESGKPFEPTRVLANLFEEVLAKRQPGLAATLFSGSQHEGVVRDGEALLRLLQARGVWFQLLAIAEENRAVYARRQLEREEGREALDGTFAQLISEAAAAKVPAANIKALLEKAQVQPVLTAHPTEAKRVTVMEIHRRIYRHLKEMETNRWTPQERDLQLDGIRNEIELLWLTGEIRLAKPSVEEEVAWGIHFFKETLFEATPEILEECTR